MEGRRHLPHRLAGRLIAGAVGCGLLFATMAAAPASADVADPTKCKGGGGKGVIGIGCEKPGTGGGKGPGKVLEGPYDIVTTTPRCKTPPGEVGKGPGTGAGGRIACTKEGITCLNEGAEYRWFWKRTETYRKGVRVEVTPWNLVERKCVDPPGPNAEAVREELLRLLPKGKAQIQPKKGKTLVGLDTNYIAEIAENPFQRTVTILGKSVQITARPTTYIWNFGDTSAPLTTNRPGRAYPHLDVVHQYRKPGTYDVDVDVQWDAQFKVGNGPVQVIPGPVPVNDGPVTPLRVLEVQPVLGK